MPVASPTPTPRPLGRDRLEPTADGTLALLSLRPKPWTARDESRALAVPGTAVRWDDAIYEVVRAEARARGGFRYVLAPWDERLVVRALVDYEAGAPGADPPGEAIAAAGAGRWGRLPHPVRALAPGFAAAVLLGWFLPFRIMGEGMSALVHELGHTVTAWAFGCTALPAVVVTIAFQQVVAAAVVIWGLLVFFAVKWRRVPRVNVALAASALVYPALAFTRAYLVLFDLGGHLAELGVASWALARALRRDRPAAESPVWSFFGFYLIARNVRLFAGVASSAAARTDYLTIAIADRNDLVKVASATGIPLEAVAAAVAAAFVIVPAAAVAFALRKRPD